MNYTIYDPATGQIQGNLQTDNQELAELNLVGQTYISGQYNSDEYYIDQGQPMLLPVCPNDSNQYKFNWTTKSWIVDLDNSIVVYRQQRNNLLSEIDRINPIWWNSLSPQQQQELITYRQDLLDVPQQSGWPTQVSWPGKPSWL